MKNLYTGVHGMIGASTKKNHERVLDDFYSTGDGAIDRLEKKYKLPFRVWECACGDGALSEQLLKNNHVVTSTDLVDRGFGKSGVDFLEVKTLPEDIDAIVTNPPYNIGVEFVCHAIELMKQNQNGVVAMLLKTQFLESINRYEKIFKNYPPTNVFQFVKRLTCYRNGDKTNDPGALMPFMWFVWDNKATHKGTLLEWI